MLAGIYIVHTNFIKVIFSGTTWVKNLLSMHPRNFVSDKIVLMYVHPPLHVSRAEILHFKYPHVWAILQFFSFRV